MRKKLLVLLALTVCLVVAAFAVRITAHTADVIEDTTAPLPVVVTPAPTPTPVATRIEPVETVTYTPDQPTTLTYEHFDELTDFDHDAALLAQVIYGEGGILSYMERAAIAWCVLNRVDMECYPDTVEEVIAQPYQFVGYDSGHPVTDENYTIACDVLTRWYMESMCCGDVGRVLPKEYIAFCANDDYTHNIYWDDALPNWDWSLPNPYE